MPGFLDGIIASHAVTTRVRKAIKEVQEVATLEQRIKDEHEFHVRGVLYARGCGMPDKPGTVRAPGVRRQEPGSVHKARFSVDGW